MTQAPSFSLISCHTAAAMFRTWRNGVAHATTLWRSEAKWHKWLERCLFFCLDTYLCSIACSMPLLRWVCHHGLPFHICDTCVYRHKVHATCIFFLVSHSQDVVLFFITKCWLSHLYNCNICLLTLNSRFAKTLHKHVCSCTWLWITCPISSLEKTMQMHVHAFHTCTPDIHMHVFVDCI